jgi:hypothetical protein
MVVCVGLRNIAMDRKRWRFRWLYGQKHIAAQAMDVGGRISAEVRNDGEDPALLEADRERITFAVPRMMQARANHHNRYDHAFG